MKSICLFLCWTFLSAAECGFHSLEFLSTGRLHPGAQPYIEQQTVFDGVPISHCDSVTHQEQFKPVLEPHSFNGTCEAAITDLHDFMKEIFEFINGTLYVQRRRGCTTSAEGLDSAFDIWAVDGEDFIQFDAGAQGWKVLSASAQRVRDSWKDDELRNNFFTIFIKEQCPKMIQQIKLKEVEERTGGNTLDGRKNLRPDIQMTFGRILGIVFTLVCLFCLLWLLFVREVSLCNEKPTQNTSVN